MNQPSPRTKGAMATFLASKTRWRGVGMSINARKPPASMPN
jgi:hypothetical protein